MYDDLINCRLPANQFIFGYYITLMSQIKRKCRTTELFFGVQHDVEIGVPGENMPVERYSGIK